MQDGESKKQHEHCSGRRRLLTGLAAGLAVPLLPGTLHATAGPRALAFHNLHTGERLAVEYHDGIEYLPDATGQIDQLLRDHRADEAYPMDTGLLDLLHQLTQLMDSRGHFEVISGYRSPNTNAKLRQQGKGVAKRSLHMQGRAIDIRLVGADTTRLRDAAISLRAGGVGYYARSNFVHVDTGRFRTW